MNTYLLIWKSTLTPREEDDYWQKLIRSVQNNGYVDDYWSTGKTKRIQPNDRLFLVRLGEEPRGIFASGWAISEVKQVPHWEEQKYAEGKKTGEIRIRYDAVADPDTDPILTISKLKNKISKAQEWQPQGSAITIENKATIKLEKEWAKLFDKTTRKRMVTAKIAQPLTGDKLYQQRARRALPILVRQAAAAATIVYEDLAHELGMPNPRNLNYVLGSIGETLINLSAHWDKEVPPIQCLVVNKNTGLPGEGVGWFITDLSNYKRLSNKQRKQLVNAELQKVYAFDKWLQVLDELGLAPVQSDFVTLNDKASKSGGGGEGIEHDELKNCVANNPTYFGLPASIAPGIKEYPLPSGDSLDVFFAHGKEDIGIEVKSHRSDTADITRGLYQCVKYQAVLEARQAANGQPQNVRTILALGGELPAELLPLKNVLGIELFEKVNNK